MALSITINKVAVAKSFAAGATVATAVASGGTAPYVYSLATGGDKFNINSSTGAVTTIANMDASNIASFSVTATDSTTGTALTVTSDVVYPNIQASIQGKFNKPSMIYKITKDIDLANGVLTIPSGCTLDFQGGSFSNGIIQGNNSKIKAKLERIFDISINLIGTFNIDSFIVEWYGASSLKEDNYNNIQKALDSAFATGVNNVRFGSGTYKFSSPLVIKGASNYVLGTQYNRVIGSGPQTTTLHYTRGTSYKSIYSALFLESSTNDSGATYNIKIEGVKIMQSSSSEDSYGIYSIAGLGCCVFKDITMYTMRSGMYFNTDIWQCSLQNIFINGGERGITMNRYGTSNVFSKLYMYGQSKTAYSIKGIYQHFENLACDSCTGICYYFMQCQATIDGLGIESPNAIAGIIVESFSDLEINSATILPIETPFSSSNVYNSYITVNNRSRAIFRNSDFGGSYTLNIKETSDIYAYWVNTFEDSYGINSSSIEFDNCRFLGTWNRGIQKPLINFIKTPTIITHSGNSQASFNYFNQDTNEPQYPFIGKGGGANMNGVQHPERLNITPTFFNTHSNTPLFDLNGNDVSYFQVIKDSVLIPRVKNDYLGFVCDEAGVNLLNSKFTPIYKRGYAIGTSEERPPEIANYTSMEVRNAACARFEGQIYYDSTLKKMIVFNGTAWVNMDGTPLT